MHERSPATSPLARHAVEQLTNALHNIAREFHAHDSLRIRIARELAPLLATEPAALTPAGLAALICRQLDEACQQANAIGTPSGHIYTLRAKLSELRNSLADVLASGDTATTHAPLDIDAGKVSPSRTIYEVTHPHSHKSLRVGDLVCMVEDERSNLWPLRTDQTLHNPEDTTPRRWAP